MARRIIRWNGKKVKLHRGPLSLFNPPGYRGKNDLSGLMLGQKPKRKR